MRLDKYLKVSRVIKRRTIQSFKLNTKVFFMRRPHMFI